MNNKFRYKEQSEQSWRYTNSQEEFFDQFIKRGYGVKMLIEVWNNFEQKWVIC